MLFAFYSRAMYVLRACYVRAVCVCAICVSRLCCVHGTFVLCACYVPAKYVLSVCYLVTGRPILLYQTAFSRKLSQDSASLIYELSLALKQKNCMPCSSESSIFFHFNESQ